MQRIPQLCVIEIIALLQKCFNSNINLLKFVIIKKQRAALCFFVFKLFMNFLLNQKLESSSGLFKTASIGIITIMKTTILAIKLGHKF